MTLVSYSIFRWNNHPAQFSELVFCEICTEKFSVFSSTQYPLSYKTGEERVLIIIHPMQTYFLLGLETFLNFPRGPRSPEVSKGRKLGSSSMDSSRAWDFLAHCHSPGEKGSPWWGRALLLWLPALLGSVLLASWLSAPWTLDLT